MHLVTEVKQKNDRLLLQNAIFQRNLSARVNTPGLSSFLLTFIVAPFVVGAVAQLGLGSKNSVSHRLYRAVLPRWMLWPLF
jgi:hypothetical protein